MWVIVSNPGRSACVRAGTNSLLFVVIRGLAETRHALPMVFPSQRRTLSNLSSRVEEGGGGGCTTGVDTWDLVWSRRILCSRGIQYLPNEHGHNHPSDRHTHTDSNDDVRGPDGAPCTPSPPLHSLLPRAHLKPLGAPLCLHLAHHGLSP